MNEFKDITIIIIITILSDYSTFICEYTILPEHKTRDTCMTLFGGMTESDDLRELGDVKLLGRWGCVGQAKGYCLAQAQNVASVQKWLINWVPMADIKVTPVLDDNEHRKLILKEEPRYMVEYKNVNSGPKQKESLYFIKYQFKPGCVDDGFKLFSTMTEEQDKQDSGLCTSFGRWHVPSLACGYAIASSPSVFDIYKWAFNWKDLCECTITPVTQDEVTRNCIKQGLGFKVKHQLLMEEMKKSTNKPALFSRICKCFY